MLFHSAKWCFRALTLIDSALDQIFVLIAAISLPEITLSALCMIDMLPYLFSAWTEQPSVSYPLKSISDATVWQSLPMSRIWVPSKCGPHAMHIGVTVAVFQSSIVGGNFCGLCAIHNPCHLADAERTCTSSMFHTFILTDQYSSGTAFIQLTMEMVIRKVPRLSQAMVNCEGLLKAHSFGSTWANRTRL